MVWRTAKEVWETDCQVGTFKSGRFSISIWACVGWNGIGPLRIFDTRMNSKNYIPMLSSVKEEMINQFSKNMVFHTAKIVKRWKSGNNIKCMDWVAQSPDLNVIENVWSQLKYKISQKGPIKSNKNILKSRIVESWNSIQKGKYKENYKINA